MELTLVIITLLVSLYGLYLAFQNQKETKKHKEFLKSLGNGLSINVKSQFPKIDSYEELSREIEDWKLEKKRSFLNKHTPPMSERPQVDTGKKEYKM